MSPVTSQGIKCCWEFYTLPSFTVHSEYVCERLMSFCLPCSDAVNSALALVRQVEEDLRCTNATQIQVEELQAVVESMLIQAQTDIDLVRPRYALG